MRHLPHPFHASCVTVLVRHGPLTRGNNRPTWATFFSRVALLVHVLSEAPCSTRTGIRQIEHSPEHACLDSPLATRFDPPWRRAAWQAATDRFHEVIVTLESLEDTARSKDFFAVEKGGDEYQTLTAAQRQLEHSRWVPHRSHVQLSQPLPNLSPTKPNPLQPLTCGPSFISENPGPSLSLSLRRWAALALGAICTFTPSLICTVFH